jgi:hypothetical protein
MKQKVNHSLRVRQPSRGRIVSLVVAVSKKCQCTWEDVPSLDHFSRPVTAVLTLHRDLFVACEEGLESWEGGVNM